MKTHFYECYNLALGVFFYCRLNSSMKINFSITYISIFLFMTDTNLFHIDFAHVFYIDKLFSKAFEFSLIIEELTY